MSGGRDSNAPVSLVSPRGRQFFCGYYDVPVRHPLDRRLLCHESAFNDRLPTGSDVARLGWINDAEGSDFHEVATTRTWNFQQGAFLRWVGREGKQICWNDGALNEPPHGVLWDAENGHHTRLERPLANISSDGNFGLSLSFERLFDFRAGYGYANRPDPFARDLCPKDDGIFLVDMQTGVARLIISMVRILEAMQSQHEGRLGKIVVNHLNFNPSSRRFIGLARAEIAQGTGPRWQTYAFTANRDGSDMRSLLPIGHVSHYFWKDDVRLIVWSDGPSGRQLYDIDTHSGFISTVDDKFFTRDGHMSISPVGNWLLYDSYPDHDRMQNLFLYSLKDGRGIVLGQFFAPEVSTREIRCDLHPRWNPDGQGFTFDSMHEGFRGIYECDVSELIRQGGL